jgi:hypothetical protein
MNRVRIGPNQRAAFTVRKEANGRVKRAAGTATRAAAAIERFIERTLAPRLEELADEVRGLPGELGQIDKRLSANIIRCAMRRWRCPTK